MAHTPTPVDIGASDGTLLSNSKLLDERGWAGLCIDPLARNFEARRCDVLRKPLTATHGQLVRFIDAAEDALIANSTEHASLTDRAAARSAAILELRASRWATWAGTRCEHAVSSRVCAS